MDNLMGDDTINIMIDGASGDIDNAIIPTDGESVINEIVEQQISSLGIVVRMMINKKIINLIRVS